MNNDCFSLITQFMPRSEAVKLTTESAAKNFPRKVVLESFDDALQFYHWCQVFDTSNLKEVTYRIYERGTGVIGWTPPSVKKLTIDVYNHCDYSIMNTVEELSLSRGDGVVFNLPDSIKCLRLERMFEGRIGWWPANLEKLTIMSWAIPEEPDVLELPDGVREIYIDYGVPVEVHVWPAMLETLTLVECEDDHIATWFDMQHGDIPEGVTVNWIQV